MNAKYVPWLIATGAALCLLAIALLLTRPAAAHEWFPPECCSGQDCEHVAADFIVESKAGWQVDYCSTKRPGMCISAFVKRGTERISQDGSYVACFNSSRMICFFAPVNS